MRLKWNNPFATKETPDIKLKKEEIEMNKKAHDIDTAMAPVDPNEFMMDAGRSELIRWQQDLSPELQVMAMRLRNWYRNDDGNWMPKKLPNGDELPALCNEECIGELIAILDPTIGRNLIMSNYERDFIRKKLIDLSNRLTLLLVANRRRFAIRMSDLTPIVGICQSTFEPAHFRALGANEKKYISATHRYLHTETDKEGNDNNKKIAWPT